MVQTKLTFTNKILSPANSKTKKKWKSTKQHCFLFLSSKSYLINNTSVPLHVPNSSNHQIKLIKILLFYHKNSFWLSGKVSKRFNNVNARYTFDLRGQMEIYWIVLKKCWEQVEKLRKKVACKCRGVILTQLRDPGSR